MSRIYFHSPSATAELRGSERAYMGLLCTDLTVGVFSPDDFGREPLLSRVFPHPYSSTMPYGRAFELAMHSGARYEFNLPDGRMVDTFTVCLNTALALGNDVIRLCARLHGQCEIHAWVDGPNRSWLADIIDSGRAASILRDDQGWEDVTALLRARNDEPVVTSYSVCDLFPSRGAADWQDDCDGDGWHDLSDDERWSRAMEGLRRDGTGLEMCPESWTFDRFFFGQGDTAFSILHAVQE
jgi:hypothetical protein